MLLLEPCCQPRAGSQGWLGYLKQAPGPLRSHFKPCHHTRVHPHLPKSGLPGGLGLGLDLALDPQPRQRRGLPSQQAQDRMQTHPVRRQLPVGIKQPRML